jgi:hypothetical protein
MYLPCIAVKYKVLRMNVTLIEAADSSTESYVVIESNTSGRGPNMRIWSDEANIDEWKLAEQTMTKCTI